MKFFNEMKLSGKIVSMVSVLIVLLLIISAVSISKMQNIGREIAEVAEELIPLTEAVTKIEISHLEQKIVFEKILNYIDYERVAGIEELKEEFKTYTHEVNKELEIAKKIAEHMIEAAANDEERNEHRDIFKHIEDININGC